MKQEKDFLSVITYHPWKKQEILIQELTFLVATSDSVVQNLEQINKAMANLYSMHLQHDHSDKVGMKTQQVREYIWIFQIKCTLLVEVK